MVPARRCIRETFVESEMHDPLTPMCEWQLSAINSHPRLTEALIQFEYNNYRKSSSKLGLTRTRKNHICDETKNRQRSRDDGNNDQILTRLRSCRLIFCHCGVALIFVYPRPQRICHDSQSYGLIVHQI